MLRRALDYLSEAFAAIWRNRTRSILTMLGMIIGTASIIAVLGISKMASGGITGTLDSFGDQGFQITVDANQDDPESAAIQYRDVRTIADELGPRLEQIAPLYQRTLSMRAAGTTVTTFAVSGSEVHKDSLVMREGRRLDEQDVATAAHVCTITGPLADHFFHGEPALGRDISLNGIRCTVVGVYAELKGGFINSIGGNEFLELPYTTFHELTPGPIDGLQIYAAAGEAPGSVTGAVMSALQRLHGSRSKYMVQDATAQIASFNTVLNVIAGALSGIGGVALLVAGIGIMNIMLVSVTERTREIGLRKSIGATRSDIVLQFLLEAVLLSFLGGGIGTLIGCIATVLAYGPVAGLVGPAPIPYVLIISVAVGFSTLIGCVFGTYPALRASRMDPIAALRS
jgi:putative ABC transport system permease protein